MIISQKILLKFIQTNDNVNWDDISYFYKLLKNFIREYQNKFYWPIISKYQTLSEDFIREFKDEVIWFYISKYYELSEDFKKEFKKGNIVISSRSQYDGQKRVGNIPFVLKHSKGFFLGD